MALAKTLIALGIAPDAAARLGYEEVAATTTAATQTSAGGTLRRPGNKIVAANIASAGHAITLPADAETGDEIIINNITANAGVLFPHSGGNVNGESSNASMVIAAQGSTNCVLRAVKLSSTRWGVWSAVVS